MPNDCRIILDNISDQVAQVGSLIVGSDAVDISGATMTAGDEGWNILVKTVDSAVQNPRLATTVALYFDVDGRSSNNAVGGPRLGADTVYALVRENNSWRMTKEVLNTKSNVFEVIPTSGSYVITNEGYVFNIPYAEVAKTDAAYWKAGVAVQDITQLSVDYVPNVGLSCAPTLAPVDRTYISMDQLAQVTAGAIVIAVVTMLILKWFKNKKKYDHTKKPD